MSIHYAAGLACAYLIAVADAAAIVVPLNGQIASGVHTYLGPKNLITVVVLVVLGTAAVAVGGVVNLAPVLRWFVRGEQPDPDQRRTATRLAGRQSIILASTWAASGAI
ncbi:MAG: adenylate/guanylate cyclase domain-containing protein, partial [Mycobacterium sp.]